MGTKLNVCKEARAEIRKIEKEFKEAVFISKKSENDKMEIGGVFITKSEEIKSNIERLLGKLEVINKELEKDSSVRDYYNDVRDRLIDYLESLSEVKPE